MVCTQTGAARTGCSVLLGGLEGRLAQAQRGMRSFAIGLDSPLHVAASRAQHPINVRVLLISAARHQKSMSDRKPADSTHEAASEWLQAAVLEPHLQ